MNTYHETETIALFNGKSEEVLKSLPDECIDTIITDPPYGLSFMGKKWDYDVPDVVLWKACLRVLKPGGTALIFAGSRTQHRMAVNVEDAGFILKDCIMWLYGSGFPKATDISKQLDKAAGETPIDLGPHPNARETLGTVQICKKNGSGRLTGPSSDEAKLWNEIGRAHV